LPAPASAAVIGIAYIRTATNAISKGSVFISILLSITGECFALGLPGKLLL
jgi:hypothetical protein